MHLSSLATVIGLWPVAVLLTALTFVQGAPQCGGTSTSVPQNIGLHSVLDTVTPRNEFYLASRWYSESGNKQTFRLFDGDSNQVPNHRPNPRTETFTDGWTHTGADDWKEFRATYVNINPTDRELVLFQIKTSDASIVMAVQVYLEAEGQLRVRYKGQGPTLLMRNAFGQTFDLRVRTNGQRQEVYLNCRLVTDKASVIDPQGTAPYNFRWGVYGGAESTQNYELTVQGAAFDI